MQGALEGLTQRRKQQGSGVQDGDRREAPPGSSAGVPGLSGSLSPAAPEHRADLGVHRKPWG